VNAPFPAPAPAPGIWQPTPPSYAPAAQGGNRNARPFLLERADQFRPGPPPALGSAQYRADLAEVRAYGSAGSTVRTPEQTETASFWFGSSLTLYTEPLRVALARSPQAPAARAKLVALFHVALVDTQIATPDTKYAYLRWRPVTAIHSADLDGDPATSPDPDWSPLHITPAHPDYPSGHSTYSGAAEQVLTALVGARTAPFPLTSPTAPGVTRTYTTWHALTPENVDARVWSGIHTRSADKAGVQLGRHRGIGPGGSGDSAPVKAFAVCGCGSGRLGSVQGVAPAAFALTATGDPVGPLVFDAVVPSAAEREHVDVGGAAVRPVQDMIGLAEPGRDQHQPLTGGDEAGPAAW
jgi:hypothetical protein